MIKTVVLTLISGVFLFLAISILFSFLPTHPPVKICDTRNVIYLTTNGIHVDLILPVCTIPVELENQLNVTPDIKFIAFGWGDRNFYLVTPEWSDLTFPVAYNALFKRSKSALHVTFYSRKANYWKSLQLCDHQQNSITEYIFDTFQKDEQGRIKRIEAAGYNEHDFFYEANGNFTMFNTCNVWVNRALKIAEVKTAVWTPFDFGVMYHIK